MRSVLELSRFIFFFFFQAEHGIRDDLVTGVQTCALPISLERLELALIHCSMPDYRRRVICVVPCPTAAQCLGLYSIQPVVCETDSRAIRVCPSHKVRGEIGRASCRERVEIAVVSGSMR